MTGDPKHGNSMICLDTTFLIDLWRNAGKKDHPTIKILETNRGVRFAVPSHGAGEFLEGAAYISKDRLKDALVFLQMFTVGTAGLETAMHYARIVSDLRSRSLLKGVSKADMWIAAWALEHGCKLITRNARHFENITGLQLGSY